ncbi:MAG: hypothetical protein C0613_08415 [Desulfobulbaceae bacterium]|nr:MAG: hypothetical protein C0613_08415 [Desulfobulbaceae bacterium]
MLAMKDLQDIALHSVGRIAMLDKGHDDLRRAVARLERRLARLEATRQAETGPQAQVLRLVR